MAKYRMDTPKGQVQFAHDQEGTDAARAKAQDLGVSNKIERWLREWAGTDPPKAAPPQGDVDAIPLPRPKGDAAEQARLLQHYKHELGILEARKRVWAEINCELTRNDARELDRLRALVARLEPPVSVGRWRSKKGA
jgi:hypothetical protein